MSRIVRAVTEVERPLHPLIGRRQDEGRPALPHFIGIVGEQFRPREVSQAVGRFIHRSEMLQPPMQAFEGVRRHLVEDKVGAAKFRSVTAPLVAVGVSEISAALSVDDGAARPARHLAAHRAGEQEETKHRPSKTALKKSEHEGRVQGIGPRICRRKHGNQGAPTARIVCPRLSDIPATGQPPVERASRHRHEVRDGRPRWL